MNEQEFFEKVRDIEKKFEGKEVHIEVCNAYLKLLKSTPITELKNLETYYKHNCSFINTFEEYVSDETIKEIKLISCTEILTRISKKEDVRGDECKLFSKEILEDYLSNITEMYELGDANLFLDSIVKCNNITYRNGDERDRLSKAEDIFKLIRKIDINKLIRNNIEILKNKENLNENDTNLVKTFLNCIGEELGNEDFFKQNLIEDCNQILQKANINIYATKEMDLIIEKYLDNYNIIEKEYNEYFKNHTNESEPLKKHIIKYIEEKASKPNFNILKEKSIRGLIQAPILNCNNSEFLKTIYRKINKSNNEDSIDKDILDNAQNIVELFIEEHKDQAILENQEDLFEKFIESLSVLKLSNKNILEQKHIDFIISQAIRKDSIININQNKYRYLLESALEDFAKNDIMRTFKNSEPECAYFFKDNMEENECGYYNNIRNAAVYNEKHLEKLCNGNFGIIETIFHENRHAKQERMLKDNPQNISPFDYSMIIENLIVKHNPIYYKNNYEKIYTEIDAREKASKHVAEYISQIISENQCDDIIETIGDNVNLSLLEYLEQQKEKYENNEKLETELYSEANLKEHETFSGDKFIKIKKDIYQIFYDEKNHLFVKDEYNPILEYEFNIENFTNMWSIKSKKSFSDIASELYGRYDDNLELNKENPFVHGENSAETNFELLRSIINRNKLMIQDENVVCNLLELINGIDTDYENIQEIKDIHEDRTEKVDNDLKQEIEFLENIIEDNYEELFEKLKVDQEHNNIEDLSEEYECLKDIKNKIPNVKIKEDSIIWKFFSEYCKLIEERFPEINNVEKIENDGNKVTEEDYMDIYNENQNSLDSMCDAIKNVKEQKEIDDDIVL